MPRSLLSPWVSDEMRPVAFPSPVPFVPPTSGRLPGGVLPRLPRDGAAAWAVHPASRFVGLHHAVQSTHDPLCPSSRIRGRTRPSQQQSKDAWACRQRHTTLGMATGRLCLRGSARTARATKFARVALAVRIRVLFIPISDRLARAHAHAPDGSINMAAEHG